MQTWISLLRAVNLGSRNKVAMPALRAALAEAGFADVRTHLQSGNVVARSSHRTAAEVGGAVEAVLRADFGIEQPVVVRTPEQVGAAIHATPFPEAATADPRSVHVVFLAGAPSPDAVAALHAADVSPEALRVIGEELHVRYAAGAGRSKLTPAWLGRQLGVEGTARNWRTVLALAELSR